MSRKKPNNFVRFMQKREIVSRKIGTRLFLATK